jgi:DhnA family fructose-bisphosphate aldolase class Ia
MKARRLGRILAADGRALVLAMDHGAIAGPMPGIESPERALERASRAGVDAVLLTRGALEAGWASLEPRVGVILRLTGGFTLLTDPQNFEERILGSAEDALFLAADAVAATVKFGHPREGDFMAQAGLLAAGCARWNLPLMIEVMVRGERAKAMGETEALALACRSAAELGADLVKAPFPGSVQAMERVSKGCPVPILVLGGEKDPDPGNLIHLVDQALAGGAAGVCMGRNLFGSPNPVALIGLLRELIHAAGDAEELAEAARSGVPPLP